MREICLARLEKTRPVLVLTREIARGALRNVTVAPITSRIRGTSTELHLGPENGVEHRCVASLDNIATIPVGDLGRTIGTLLPEQERALAAAIVLAFDLAVPLRHRGASLP